MQYTTTQNILFSCGKQSSRYGPSGTNTFTQQTMYKKTTLNYKQQLIKSFMKHAMTPFSRNGYKYQPQYHSSKAYPEDMAMDNN